MLVFGIPLSAAHTFRSTAAPEILGRLGAGFYVPIAITCDDGRDACAFVSRAYVAFALYFQGWSLAR